MRVMLFIWAALLIVAIPVQIRQIGRPRNPLSRSEVAVMVVVNVIIIGAILLVTT